MLVLDARIAMRAVPRVLEIVADTFGLPIDIPHWTSGRLWLMRLGCAMLTQPLAQGKDWAWLIDHSVQIGQEKCLVILGIRLQDLPKPGHSLKHQDMQLIDLVSAKCWKREDVDRALEKAVERTGVPRVIVNDHGSDLHGGVELFRTRHEETAEVYDIKHKAACLLKQRLAKLPRWQAFQRQVGQTRCAIQQTELSFLVPPTPKTKARFMNLEAELAWAEGVLQTLDNPEPIKAWATSERLEEKLGWLREYGDDFSEWSRWQQVVNVAVCHVADHGIRRTTARSLYQALPRPFAHASTKTLAVELIRFVVCQAKPTKPGERFPGSTEVLESCFGKYKQLEKQQSRGGFTKFVVSFGAMMAERTTSFIYTALERTNTKHVYEWCKEHLGTTLFGKRKMVFNQAQQKADE